MEVFNPELMVKRVLFPDGEYGSTTCISYKKLLHTLNFRRDVSIIDFVPMENLEVLSGLYTGVKNAFELAELAVKEHNWNPRKIHILTVGDNELNGVALYAIECDYFAYLNMLKEEAVSELGLENGAKPITTPYKLFGPEGCGVRYDKYKDALLTVGNNDHCPQNKVNIIFYDDVFCFKNGLMVNTPYNLDWLMAADNDIHSNLFSKYEVNYPFFDEALGEHGKRWISPTIAMVNAELINWPDCQREKESSRDYFIAIVLEALRWKQHNNIPFLTK